MLTDYKVQVQQSTVNLAPGAKVTQKSDLCFFSTLQHHEEQPAAACVRLSSPEAGEFIAGTRGAGCQNDEFSACSRHMAAH